MYLGGVISNDGSLVKEISTRCKKASIAFGRLWRNVFGRKDISVEVKIQMCRATVLAALLYGLKHGPLNKNNS